LIFVPIKLFIRSNNYIYIILLFLIISCNKNISNSNNLPNVIVILTDDQGWGDLSLHGNTDLQTPNIDNLAKSGVQFDRFYVSPVCSPTRAEFLTGRYHTRSGVYSTSAGGERLNLDEKTIADVFQNAGYQTGTFGKWHNGMQFPYHPNGRGFNEFYGFSSGHWGNYFSPMLEHNGKIVKGDGYCVDDFTNKAISFMEKSIDEKRPFFTYLAYNTPHSPMQVPDKYWERFKNKDITMRNIRDNSPQDLDHTRAALAMCENIDWNVGRLVEKLEQLNVADNTIIVFFHDNGPNGVRWNEGMKGRKGTTDEGGVRSPLFISWAKKIKSNTIVKQIAGAIDLLPTLSSLAGVDLVGNKKLDGIDLSPWIIDSSLQSNDRLIFSHWRGRVSVRSQRFRLDHEGQLFDMHVDSMQLQNVEEKHPKVASNLKKAVDDFKNNSMQINVVDEHETSSSYIQMLSQMDERPFVICDSNFEWTQLPARDAVAHGNIIRSNRYPNCSYFLNWTSIEDKITWNVEALSSGKYEVQVYYTCKAKNLGCKLELRFNNSVLRKVVDEPHDPVAFGKDEDRVPRIESYVKSFKPFNLGIIDIEKGRGKLSLSIPEMSGDEGIEFRLLMFRRIS
tara:strand:+ start:7962 stop:9812 length:1851 start_codon:yes stop_codon:yes gene_type:complete